ncbi:MAG: DUF2470 domain-containing protein [Leucobacter sp.]
MNEGQRDALREIAEFHGHPGEAVTISGITARGLTLEVTSEGISREVRIPWPAPLRRRGGHQDVSAGDAGGCPVRADVRGFADRDHRCDAPGSRALSAEPLERADPEPANRKHQTSRAHLRSRTPVDETFRGRFDTDISAR